MLELDIQRIHAEDGVADFGQECEEFFRIAVRAVGLVCDHIGEVVDVVHILGSLVELVADLILQLLRQPDQTADAALGLEELVGGDVVLAVAHEARGLHAAASHGGHLGEGHAERGDASVFTAGDDNAH